MRAAEEGAVCEVSVSAEGRAEEGGAVREPGDAGDGAWWWWSVVLAAVRRDLGAKYRRQGRVD